MERSHQKIYHTRRLVEPPGPDFKTALPSQYLLLFWSSLANTESEANNNLMMRRAGLSSDFQPNTFQGRVITNETLKLGKVKKSNLN